MGSGRGSLEVQGSTDWPHHICACSSSQETLFQIFVIHRLTSVDTLLGSGIGVLQLGITGCKLGTAGMRLKQDRN